MIDGDIILQQDGSFLTKNGDFVVETATGQHQAVLIVAEKGTIRQHADSGVAAMSYLLDHNEADLRREISRELTRDGQTVRKIDVSNGINVNAGYE